jgi:uncharacterized Tic20 family protein
MKKCPNCGADVQDDAAFCGVCGTKLNVEAQPQPVQETPVNPNPASSQNTYNTQNQGMLDNGQYNQNYAQYQQPRADQYDHTAEFVPADISDNKVICMLVYLMPMVGVIIALLADRESSTSKKSYIGFHVRQGLKIEVLALLAILCCFILTLILTLFVVGTVSTYSTYGYTTASGGSAFAFILLVAVIIADIVVRIICFVHVCKGKAVEAPIVRSVGFLK